VNHRPSHRRPRLVRGRVFRAKVALGLAPGCALVNAVATGMPVRDWWPSLVVPALVPLAVLLVAPTRAGRPAAFLAAALATPLALFFMLFGGWFLLPPVGALWWTAFAAR
jgi:hypothetical protein